MPATNRKLSGMEMCVYDDGVFNSILLLFMKYGQARRGSGQAGNIWKEGDFQMEAMVA